MTGDIQLEIPLSKQILDKYATNIVRKNAIFQNFNGELTVNQNKKESYNPEKYSDDIILWIPPMNCIRLEFEDLPERNIRYIEQCEWIAKSIGFDYCITEHQGGKSQYFNMFNLPPLENVTDWRECKLALIESLLDKGKEHLDKTNLYYTLSPVIGHPHWKPKYKGAIHQIIRGKNPLEHYNIDNKIIKEIYKKTIKNKNKIREKIKLLKMTPSKWVEDFLLNYCCNKKLPKGERHSVICKNLGILIAPNPDKELIMQQYTTIQGNEKNEILGWLMEALRGTYTDINTIELKKYIEKYNIPYNIPKEFTESKNDGGVIHIAQVDDCYANVEILHSISPFFYDEVGHFWLWDDKKKKYKIVDEIDMMNVLEYKFDFNGLTVNAGLKGQYIESIKRVGRIKKPMDAPTSWIQFNDIIFDVSTKKYVPSSPDFFICNPIPHSLAQSDETPELDRMFEEWVGKKYVRTMYEIIAYSCIPSYEIHAISCLIGGGRNGKSTFLRLLEKFIGIDNICSTDLDVLLESRFEKSKLYKKLVCLMGETNFKELEDTTTIKKLTGQDLVSVEFKNKQAFDYLNYAKIIIASNSMPTTTDNTDGFNRRWNIITFFNEFPEGRDILKDLPEDLYGRLAMKCIKVLPEFLEQRHFTNIGSIEDRRKAMQLASNPLPLFLDKCCLKDELNFYCKYSEMFSAYMYFLNKTKQRAVSRKVFSNYLQSEGIDMDKTSKKIWVGNEEQWVNSYWISGYKLCNNWKDIIENIVLEIKQKTSGEKLNFRVMMGFVTDVLDSNLVKCHNSDTSCHFVTNMLNMTNFYIEENIKEYIYIKEWQESSTNIESSTTSTSNDVLNRAQNIELNRAQTTFSSQYMENNQPIIEETIQSSKSIDSDVEIEKVESSSIFQENETKFDEIVSSCSDTNIDELCEFFGDDLIEKWKNEGLIFEAKPRQLRKL